MESRDGDRKTNDKDSTGCSAESILPWSSFQPIQKLPWLVIYDWIKTYKDIVMTTCSLADPSIYVLYEVKYDFYDPKRETSFDMKLCASKHHYLLLSVERQDKTNSFFSFNPLTMEFIKLSDLDSGFKIATFSSIPTSSDCVFIAFDEKKHENNITVSLSTCSLGDQKWNTRVYDHGCNFPSIQSVVFFQGVFYCLLGHGWLATFDVSLQEWTMLENLRPLDEFANYDLQEEDLEFYMMESEEQLLVACLEKGRDRFSVFRFDQSVTAWVKIQNLGNRALFFGCGSYYSLLVRTGDRLVNKLYYLQGQGVEGYKLYSLEDNGERCKNEDFDKGVYRWLPRYGMSGLGMTWIEPPDDDAHAMHPQEVSG